MTIALPSGAPFPVTYRELWLPPAINGNATLPTSVEGGHGLTLTGARKGTTVDGVHFEGSVNSVIDCGVIHNAQAKIALSFRFKLDQNHAAGSNDKYLWGKRLGVNDYIYLMLVGASGRLLFRHYAGGVQQFGLSPAQATWNAGQMYHIYAATGQAIGGGAASDGARLRVDNGVAQIDANMNALPNGGNWNIGRHAAGMGNTFVGVIADFFAMTDDVTGAEETLLYKGIPPADAVHAWLLDEGRLGSLAYDQGSAPANGTLGSACTWDYGQVQQPVLSFDRINDRANSPAGIDISGDTTTIIILKMKTTMDAFGGAGPGLYPIMIQDGVSDYFLLYYNYTGNTLDWRVIGSSVAQGVFYTGKPAIDDYLIVIGTANSTARRIELYVNGSLIGRTLGIGAMTGLPCTAYLGASSTGTNRDINKNLFTALIDGAFNERQALAYSRYLRNIFNLPIAI